MSWWQQKLLRYALRYGLSRTGLLDDDAVDLDNLDITIGKKNVIDLKDVALNINRIAKLAHLPPSLRLETARVLSLRLTIPADFYQSSIVAELHGLEIGARLEQVESTHVKKESRPRARSPVSAKTPQHRKTNRRLHSPPPHNRGGMDSSDEDLHLPHVQHLATSFLLDEPLHERRELEALAYTDDDVAESVISESTEADVGTGLAIGVPAFLATFLQGIVDRLKVHVQNVQVSVETEIKAESQESMPAILRLKVRNAELHELSREDTQDEAVEPRRHFRLDDISLDLLTENRALTSLSTVASFISSATGRSSARSPAQSTSPPRAGAASQRPSSTNTTKSSSSASMHSMGVFMQPTIPEPQSPQVPPSSPSPRLPLPASVADLDADQFTDAMDDEYTKPHDLDIQPGDDNISWGSRRSKTNAPADDLWKSMISGDDLPESLLMLPERAPTPKTSSTRSNSPFQTRQQRPVSPHSRGFQGPDSWPRPDGSPQQHRSQRSPGSWPTLDQSRCSALEPRDQVITSAYGDDETVASGREHAASGVETRDNAVDNKHAALEQVSPERPIPETPPEPDGPMDESMLTSQVFSHEEAQSMYMSAMTTSPKMDMPGGWSSPAHSARSSIPEGSHLPTLDEVLGQDSEQPGLDGAQASHEARSGNATPRAHSPELPNQTSTLAEDRRRMSATELLHVSMLSIALPTTSNNSPDATPESLSNRATPLAKSVTPTHGMPGTFSAYSDMSRSRIRSGPASVHPDLNSVSFGSSEKSSNSSIEPTFEVTLGTVCLQVDVAAGRLLYELSEHMAEAFKHQNKKPSKPASNSKAPSSTVGIAVRIERARLTLPEQLDQKTSLKDLINDTRYGAVDLKCEDLSLRMGNDTSLQIGTLGLLLGGNDLITFDRDRGSVANSQLFPSEAPVIAVNVSKNRAGANKRPVTDVSVHTAPVIISVDLLVIEETFSSIGGLSGMLELGSSVFSVNAASSPSATKPPKGVRFAQEPSQQSRTDPEIKLNSRISGITASLRGPTCSVLLRTSTLKTIYREAGVMATIERIVLSGPHMQATPSEPPLCIDIASLKVEYLLTPQDKDLERLLSLLTPSKDKYDDDDDIIIDTLLSQRRKGAILRLQVGDVQAKVEDWEGLSRISALGDDLAKLSAVANYLPEDDKPGLLTTLRVKEGEVRLPVNERFGQLRIALQDLHLAHVGIPALLAFSIGNLFASQAGGPQILHPLLPMAGTDASPVVMARMLGDEVEPTVKVKLYNLCAEYSVPVVLDLTGLDKEVEPEALVNELAQSVANLAMAQSPSKPARSPTSDLSGTSSKKTNISLLVHDSAVGLTPQKLPSKLMLVLSDIHLSTVVPPADRMSAKVELRKAAVFVTDRHSADINDQPSPTHVSSHVPNTTQRLANALVKQGFVSVGSVMAAEIVIRAQDSDQLNGAKAVEVDVKNELFLLETCADSTQTLIAALGDLAPPTPPNRTPKYLTQPMQIEDMMASFTGDPFVQPEEQPETLFDADDGNGDELESRLGISMLDNEETNELLAESEMSATLYGPVSGVFGMDTDPDRESSAGDYPETAESLLEEDPFEMPTSPDEMQLGDAALMRELKKQCKPASVAEPVDLGLHEVDDLGFDALGSGQQALGSQYRFNAPYIGGRKRRGKSTQHIPFRLRLRDFHVIWHIYDGYDWQRTRDGIVEAVEQVEMRAEERRAKRRQSLQDREDDESVIGDFLFNSIYIGVPADHDAQELRRQINRNIDEDVSETASIPVSGVSRPTTQYSAAGQPRQRQRRRLKLGRSKSHKIAFELKGVSADVLIMPPGSGEVVSSVDLRLKEFEIFDKVPTSTWRKFLTHLDNDPAKREMSKPMFHIQLENVKTLESHAASEIVLRVSVLPLRLHVDQDALDFITRFFEFKDAEMVASADPGEQPFLQRVEVDTVDMCLDYKPKNVDYAGIRSGKTTEFMNFVTLEGCNIRLRHAIVYGLRGFDALHPTLNDIWMPDIKRNQLPRVLAGLAPVRSLVNIGSGMRDVVAIPVREYKKDGRIVRSIQKGAFHFGKTTASELARLGAKVALGTQTMLANAEEFLAPEASASRRPGSARHVSSDQGWHDVASDHDEPQQRAVSAYANQPLGVLSGLKSARRYLEHDLLTARDALIAVQGEVLESRGPGGAAAAVVKHAPTVILRPVIGATRAVGTTLLGVGNQIDREHLRKVDDKYKRR
ncbi:hypothetical protein AC578_10733 [Pseudocercospora eumusae]|uniref:Autophagy-related protein 2 n=1 Tax=Pseudocercospora eumusae TaxID=321146 RepID=A0A139H4C5_9PEZI|nr:hypothetical protein AC578_10733 [Pseudocercospora eumusae]